MYTFGRFGEGFCRPSLNLSFLRFRLSAEPAEVVALHRPWRLRNFAALQEYTATLPQEMREWVLALFVDGELGLLAVETVACGSISGAMVNVGHLVCRGRSLRAGTHKGDSRRPVNPLCGSQPKAVLIARDL